LDIYEEREGKAATLMVQIITIDADAKADSSERPGSQNVAERGSRESGNFAVICRTEVAKEAGSDTLPTC